MAPFWKSSANVQVFFNLSKENTRNSPKMMYICIAFQNKEARYNMEEKKKKSILKPLLWIFGILLLLGIGAGIYAYRTIFEPIKLEETVVVYIDNDATYEDVVRILNNEVGLPSERVFHLLAERMNFPNMIRPGRFAIQDGMTMVDLIRMLRNGSQEPIRLTFNNIRIREDLAGRLSQQLELDSLSLLNALNDPTIAERFGFTHYSFPAMFIPNTYEVFWNISVDNLLNRMYHEFNVFWNEDRRRKAEKIELTPIEVSILASIVEAECRFADEYSKVAGLFLNRLRRGMRLETDPTVIFAHGDFTIRRVLFRHLEIDSPFNTYRHVGLPPGPIRIPSPTAIDATLSPMEHNYIFMTANSDFSGRHLFAVTHAQHQRNANAWHRALNERRIFR
jgi:UPF0755 protein